MRVGKAWIKEVKQNCTNLLFLDSLEHVHSLLLVLPDDCDALRLIAIVKRFIVIVVIVVLIILVARALLVALCDSDL